MLLGYALTQSHKEHLMSIHHLIALSVLGVGLISSPAAMAQNKQPRADNYSTYKKLNDEPPPEFVPPEPWIKPNIRVGAGLGAFSLSNDGAAAANIGGFGLSGWAHLGDKFFDFIGYYVSLRASIFSFNAIEANGQSFDNFNSNIFFKLACCKVVHKK